MSIANLKIRLSTLSSDASVFLNGKDITHQILSIEIHQKVGQLPRVKLEFITNLDFELIAETVIEVLRPPTESQ